MMIRRTKSPITNRSTKPRSWLPNTCSVHARLLNLWTTKIVPEKPIHNLTPVPLWSKSKTVPSTKSPIRPNLWPCDHLMITWDSRTYYICLKLPKPVSCIRYVYDTNVTRSTPVPGPFLFPLIPIEPFRWPTGNRFTRKIKCCFIEPSQAAHWKMRSLRICSKLRIGPTRH